MAVAQSDGCWVCRPLREQARSHRGSVSGISFIFTEDQMWGDGGGSVTWMLGVPASSRASSLPQGGCAGYKFCVRWRLNVGAGLLAKAMCQLAVMLDVPASSRASFAPTDLTGVRPGESGRLLGRLAVDVDLGRPVNHAGRTQALWSGQPGMDAGLAALGHGWPFAAGPRSNAGARAHRA